jgi:TonB-linked SusC/RagA family outer membrane protein
MFMLLLFTGSLFAQEKVVSGLVTDEKNQPLPFVNVVLKGTTVGTVSDLEGKYTLKLTGSNLVLEFRSVGFTTQEVKVGNSSVINVQLQPDVKQLDELVVIGYGVQKRSDLTGSVASVKAEELTKMATTGIASALQGKAAGVQISQNTGAPGSDVTVRVRGISSLNGGFPLWIVDGVPSSPNSVNSSDIESIEILKDASSAAIYGSNGANGVILVTTKKGKSGKPVANLNYYHGVQSVPNRIDVANTEQFTDMYTEYLGLKGKNNVINDKDLKTINYLKEQPTYDYQDMIFRVAQMDNVDFNVSGGNDNLTTYFGIGYVSQEGILKKSDFERFNLRLNSTYKINDWLKVGENVSFNQSTRNGWEEWQYNNEYSTPIISAITVHPYLPPYDSTGNWVPRTFGNTDDPMAAIDLLNNESKNYSLNASGYVRVQPFKGFAFESRVSSNVSVGQGFSFNQTYRYGSSLGQFNDISKVNRSMSIGTGYNWQNIISYNTSIANDINFDMIAGYEVGASKGNDISGMRQHLLTEEPEMWYFNASTDDSTGTQMVRGGGYESAGYSYFGRISMDYKGKYLVQGNFRRDYSSRFGPNFRAGNFPGLSLGWKFTEEEFVKEALPFLSFGKLRYAYGVAGNNAVPDYGFYSTVKVLQSFKYSFDNSTTLATGAGPDKVANLSIHWEDVVTHNIGLDLGFFDNKLNIGVERFLRYNVGMLIPITLPGYAGWTVRDPSQESNNVDPRPWVNVGSINNKGWEFTASLKDNVGKLAYDINLSYSNVSNMAIDLGADSVRVSGSVIGLKDLCRTETGYELANFYGFKVDRIFQPADMGTLPNGKPGITNQPAYTNSKGELAYAQPNAMPGDFKFVDLNNDGKLTNEDKTILGNPFPKHNLSLNLNLYYGIFDFSMFWEGAFDFDVFNGVKYYGVNQSGLYNWNADYVANHYRENELVAKNSAGETVGTFAQNLDAKYPRLDPLNKNGNFDRVSDFFVEDASYMRLRNIQLGVTIPSEFTNKLSLNQVRIYVGGQNLLTLTKYSGMDPEVTRSGALEGGIDRAAYPQARNIIFGVNLKF